MVQEHAAPASLRGYEKLQWYCEQDDESLTVHCDDGDHNYRIRIEKAKLVELALKPADTVVHACYHLGSQARVRRVAILREKYGSMH